MRVPTHLPVRPVVVTALYLIKACVGPVEFLRTVVDRQPVRRPDPRPDERLHVPPVRVRALDARLPVVPVRPVDPPTKQEICQAYRCYHSLALVCTGTL